MSKGEHDTSAITATMGNIKYEIWIVWGEQDSNAAEDGRWDDMGNSACQYEFETEAERDAFIEGVNEAVGWTESYTLEGEALQEYLAHSAK